MTARYRFRVPFLLEPDEAARRIVAGIAANKALIVFPWPVALAGRVFRTLPPAWTRS